MLYYDDMNSREGFDDGERVPLDIDIIRQAYIQTINHFAELLSSDWRAVADDSGHGAFLCVARLNDLNRTGVKPEDYHRADMIPFHTFVEEDTEDVDDEYMEAVEMAKNVDVDHYIETTTIIRPSLQAELNLIARRFKDDRSD